MAYTKTTWKNRVVQNPNTYLQQQNADGTVTLVPKEGTVTEAGTPVNAVNMNHIEDGIATVDTNLGNINDSALDASVKGKSLTNMIKVLFQNVNNGKNSVYSAIVDKGTIPASKDFADLVAGINDIGGKQDFSDYLLNMNHQYKPISFVENEGLWVEYNSSPNGKCYLFDSSGSVLKTIDINKNGYGISHVTKDYILWLYYNMKNFLVTDHDGNILKNINAADTGGLMCGCINTQDNYIYFVLIDSNHNCAICCYDLNGNKIAAGNILIPSNDIPLFVPIKNGVLTIVSWYNVGGYEMYVFNNQGTMKQVTTQIGTMIGQIFTNTLI